MYGGVMDSLFECPPLPSRYRFRRFKCPEMKLAQSFGFRSVNIFAMRPYANFMRFFFRCRELLAFVML
jgi:hypothetical protein